MSDNTPNIYELDEQYKSFPSFEDWRKTRFETSKWDEYTESLSKQKHASPKLLKNALEIVERATAIDTGALEGLYQTDRGFTITTAAQGALWLAKIEESKGAEAKQLIQSQFAAYEYIMDLATNNVPVSESAIREVHEMVCEGQKNYQAHNSLVGVQNVSLEKGVYKRLPNHVEKPDGSTHSYAPVEMVSPEMHRLCTELRSDSFKKAHPVLQASYVHYAFVVVHPFADGNGRVARALASIYTYRAQSMPLLILAGGRLRYLDSLEAADRGNHHAFIDFILESALDTIRIIEASIMSASSPAINDMLKSLEQLSLTRSGYTHVQINAIGKELLESFTQELKNAVGDMEDFDNLKIQVKERGGITAAKPKENYRFVSQDSYAQGGILTVSTSNLLKNVTLSRIIFCEVPVDSESNDDILILSGEGPNKPDSEEIFAARVSELLPSQSPALQVRLSIIVSSFIRASIDKVIHDAQAINRRS